MRDTAKVGGALQDIGNRLVELLPRLRRFALALSGRRDVADDLVQKSCERALSKSDSWIPGTNFDAWVFRILRNAWIDDVRHHRIAGKSDDIYEREDLAATGGQDPESRLTLQKVWKVIGELPEDQRDILLLVCVEGLAYKEVAAMLEIPLGTVMSRLARARAKIAERTGIDSPVGR